MPDAADDPKGQRQPQVEFGEATEHVFRAEVNDRGNDRRRE